MLLFKILIRGSSKITSLTNLFFLMEILRFFKKILFTNEALKYMSNVVKKKSIAFLLSDFMDQDYIDTLRYVAKKHDLTGIRVCDQHEKELPKIGLVKLLDPETKEEIWVDTMDQQVQNNYAAYFNEQSRYFKDAFLKSGTGKIDISIKNQYAVPLALFNEKEFLGKMPVLWNLLSK